MCRGWATGVLERQLCSRTSARRCVPTIRVLIYVLLLQSQCAYTACRESVCEQAGCQVHLICLLNLQNMRRWWWPGPAPVPRTLIPGSCSSIVCVCVCVFSTPRLCHQRYQLQWVTGVACKCSCCWRTRETRTNFVMGILERSPYAKVCVCVS